MRKLLLVEDDEFSRDALGRHLQRRGFEVVTAATGQQALDAVASERPDLVLLDVGLPDIDGWTVATRLRADAATATLPIVALTAHVTDEDRARARDVGCNAFETKPVQLKKLLERIARVLGEVSDE